MVEQFGEIKYGYNKMTDANKLHKEMMMDIGVYKNCAGQTVEFHDEKQETAFVILTGITKVFASKVDYKMERTSVFDDLPQVLHVCRSKRVQFTAIKDTEILVIKTENDVKFDTVFYDKNSVNQYILGDNQFDNTARRVIRDVFNYTNAPYSNLVVGEIINLSGRWSSYPPHSHPQPEVYYHRFDKKEGFGASFVGENVYKTGDNCITCATPNLNHQQTVAPGYNMYYCWIIRHLPNNPWEFTRNYDDKHKWLLEENPSIWEPSLD